VKCQGFLSDSEDSYQTVNSPYETGCWLSAITPNGPVIKRAER